MKIGYGAFLPVPIEHAFAFVADPANWPSFFPGVLAATKDDDWGRIGSQARLTSVVLGRTLTMQIELTEWAPPTAFRYSVHRDGGPSTDDNRRTFETVAGGTRLTGTTEIPARPGAAGVLDRGQMLLARALFVAAMARLPRAAAQGRDAGN